MNKREQIVKEFSGKAVTQSRIIFENAIKQVDSLLPKGSKPLSERENKDAIFAAAPLQAKVVRDLGEILGIDPFVLNRVILTALLDANEIQLEYQNAMGKELMKLSPEDLYRDLQ